MAMIRQLIDKTRGVRGVPIVGGRLSQETQAGKSALAWRLKKDLAAEREAQDLPANPHQIVIITITNKMTLREFYQEILRELGDEFYAPETERGAVTTTREDRRTLAVLEKRIASWVVRLDVDLIVADEAQRLDRKAEDATDVTQKIQTFLDRGVAPLLLIGNGDSPSFFQKNKDLAARLGDPIVLKRLEPKQKNTIKALADAILFRDFCGSFDDQLVSSNAVRVSPELVAEDMLDALAEVSSGHVGRVARLLEFALPRAVARGAATIERFDLSNVVRSYCISNKWVGHDPFSR